MADKLKLSSETTEILSKLSSRLDLRRNTICRIALAISISSSITKPPTDADYSGLEFNKTTIMGTEEFAFNAMAAYNLGEQIDPNESFNTVIRDHIVNGLKVMGELYDKVNSPSDFVEILCNYNASS